MCVNLIMNLAYCMKDNVEPPYPGYVTVNCTQVYGGVIKQACHAWNTTIAQQQFGPLLTPDTIPESVFTDVLHVFNNELREY